MQRVRHDLNQSVLEEQFLSILQCAQVADKSRLVAGEESGGEGEEYQFLLKWGG